MSEKHEPVMPVDGHGPGDEAVERPIGAGRSHSAAGEEQPEAEYGDTILRPIREDDLDGLDRFWLDPESASEFQWAGFRDPKAFRRRWEEDGWLGGEHSELAVARGDGECAGIVSWKDRTIGAGKALVFEIGIILLPEHRGHGVGTAAQRLLVEYLFANTPAHRIEAFTEVGNVREQRALEKAGFEQEGVLRDVIFRGGQWRSSCVYSLIRPG